MNLKEEIEKSKKVYSEEWNYTSEFYFKNNYYSTLASKLPEGINQLIEIGCGNGYSTLALSEKANKLISIDENQYCINNTFNLLTEMGKKAQKTLRGSVDANFTDISNFSYEMVYENVFNEPDHHIHCIEGDVLVDNQLIEFLKNIKNTDAITCWMIGVHGLMLNEKKQLLKGRNSLTRTPQMVQDYKLDVIEQIAKISRAILNQNGILSIVERVSLEHINKFTTDEVLNLYNRKVEPYGLKLINDFDVTIIDSISQMQMVSSQGAIQSSKLGLLYLEYKKQ